MVFHFTLYAFSILILSSGLLTLLNTHGQVTRNIALNKPAFQQNQFTMQPNEPDEGKFDANNAVDGLKSDLSGLGGQCTISANNQSTATWWVNLTRFVNIHYITIYHRTDNLKWDSSNGYVYRFLGFSVYVSNTTSRLDGTLCFKDNKFTINTIPAVFNTTCPVYGQYVIYYNERLPGVVYSKDYSTHAFADICEFEVYGCDIGYYGHNCTETCGHCIDPAQCSRVDGTCSTGCRAGYFGRLCKTECKNGTFGLNCNESCSHYSDLLHCSTVNGTCLTGCVPGYEKPQCQKACSFGFFGIGCQQECSSFCKSSRDCHHVSGICRDGCRSGWQGDDCFEVSKIKEERKDWESEFHGFVAAFCITLILNGVLIAFIIVKRIRQASPTLAKDQVKEEKQSKIDSDASKQTYKETSYQELGEITKSEIYESCQ